MPRPSRSADTRTRCSSRATSAVPQRLKAIRLHPASLGGTDIFAQASILGMYDPDRAQSITHLGRCRVMGIVRKRPARPADDQKAVQGAGMRILTPTISSPTFKDQMQSFLAMYPQAKWHSLRAGQSRQRSRRREASLRSAGGNALRLVEGRRNRFARRRLPVRRLPRQHTLHPRFRQAAAIPTRQMSRLYVIESRPSSTGAKADHRLPMKASEIGSASPRAFDMGLQWANSGARLKQVVSDARAGICRSHQGSQHRDRG